MRRAQARRATTKGRSVTRRKAPKQQAREKVAPKADRHPKHSARAVEDSKPNAKANSKPVAHAPVELSKAELKARSKGTNGAAGKGAHAPLAKGRPESEPPPSAKGNAAKNRERKEVQQLIEMGKSKGFLTYDEVNDALPADVVADQMDDVMGVLGDEDIEIVDAATQVKIAPKRIVEEEAAEKKQVPRDRDKNDEEADGYYSK